MGKRVESHHEAREELQGMMVLRRMTAAGLDGFTAV